MSRYVIFLGLLGAIFVSAAAMQLLSRALHLGLDLTAHSGPGQVLLYSLVIVWIVAFARRVRGDVVLPTVRLYWSQRQRALVGFGATFGITWLGVLAAFGLMGATGHMHWSSAAWAELDLIRAAQIVLAVLTVLVLTTSEELIFRAFLLNYLRGSKPTLGMRVAAVLFGSLVFTLVHHFSDPGAWLRPDNTALFVGLYLLGVVLSVTYWATGSLACAIGLHTGLLTSEVFRGTSHLLPLEQSVWWMGIKNDIRTAPLAWLLFVLLLVLVLAIRHPLRRIAGIETNC